MVVVVIGPAGAGKTTVGQALARQLGWPFHDGDDLHSAASIAKMTRGEPLTDADRWPWLDAIHERIARYERAGEPAVIACSALKQTYRDRLRAGLTEVRFVYLDASAALLEERLETRAGHFMKREMVRTQLADLEPPRHALTIDASCSPDQIVASIRRALGI